MVAITFDPAPLTSPVDDLAFAPPRLRVVPDSGTQARRPATVALAAVAAAIVLAAFAYLAFTPELADPGTIPVAETGYTAVAGDTMWSIAQDHAPAGTASSYVERLVAVNGTSTVTPGQAIALPRS